MVSLKKKRLVFTIDRFFHIQKGVFMNLYKYKGKRIRASDKNLVYRFCANVKHFFTLLGKMFFTLYGKEFFTYFGKQIFTSYGKYFFTLPGKQIFYIPVSPCGYRSGCFSR